eukprot:15462668-Alexandrium_andersonii.AAC.1
MLGVAGQNGDLWYLTLHGVSLVTRCERLHSPKRIMVHPRASSKKDFTMFELVELLDADGWACMEPPRRKKSEPLTPFSRTGPKIWYLPRSGTVVKNYLIALALARDGVIKQGVPHLKTSKFYADLIKRSQKQQESVLASTDN